MSETATCSESTGTGWRIVRCARPVKDAGLCGIHLAAKRRREANEVARQERWATEARLGREAKEVAAALTELLGIPVRAGWRGGVSIDHDHAMKWLAWRRADTPS